MRIPLIGGRDFRPGDASPGAAIVNEAFAKQFFNGESPIGKRFAKEELRYEVVGVVRDAPYRSVRESILPVAYVPFRQVDSKNALQPMRSATFIVRTSGSNPLVARRVTVDVFAMVLTGALLGLCLGMASVRSIESLLYQVKPTDLPILVLPSLTILAAALLAALPAVIRAMRIDPVTMLRVE